MEQRITKDHKSRQRSDKTGKLSVLKELLIHRVVLRLKTFEIIISDLLTFISTKSFSSGLLLDAHSNINRSCGLRHAVSEFKAYSFALI